MQCGLGLHEAGAIEIVTASRAVVVRCPVNELHRLVDAVLARVILPTDLGGLKVPARSGQIPVLRERENLGKRVLDLRIWTHYHSIRICWLPLFTHLQLRLARRPSARRWPPQQLPRTRAVDEALQAVA